MRVCGIRYLAQKYIIFQPVLISTFTKQLRSYPRLNTALKLGEIYLMRYAIPQSGEKGESDPRGKSTKTLSLLKAYIKEEWCQEARTNLRTSVEITVGCEVAPHPKVVQLGPDRSFRMHLGDERDHFSLMLERHGPASSLTEFYDLPLAGKGLRES